MIFRHGASYALETANDSKRVMMTTGMQEILLQFRNDRDALLESLWL